MRSRRPSDRLIERCEAVPLAVSQAVAGVGGVVLLALPAARVPIGVAMLAVALGDSMIVTGVEPTLQSLRSAAYDTFASYTFSIVPLFLLMGEFATQAGLSEALFRSANAWLGRRRGGMEMATIGRQRRLRRDRRIVAGHRGDDGPGRPSGDAPLRLLGRPGGDRRLRPPTAGRSPGPGRGGPARPLARGGALGPRVAIRSLLNTVRSTGMIFLIVLGAERLNVLLAVTRLPQTVAQAIADAQLAPLMVLVAVLTLYLLLGTVMDSLGMILLTTPIFFPIVVGLEFGLTPDETAISFGILTLVTVEVGLITPPVGLNVYIIHALAKDVPLIATFRGVIPFLITDLVRIALLVAFPGITLFVLRL